MIVSLRDIIFMYDHRYYNTQGTLKFSSKFQIILKLLTDKSCTCLSELPETKFEGSVVLINGAAWSAMCETR